MRRQDWSRGTVMRGRIFLGNVAFKTPLPPTETGGYGVTPGLDVRFCPNCGKPVVDGARYCVKCGAILPRSDADAMQAPSRHSQANTPKWRLLRAV